MCRLIVCIAALSAVARVALADTKEAATESSVVIMRSAPCPTVPNPPGCGAPNWIDLLSTKITCGYRKSRCVWDDGSCPPPHNARECA
jgi:hypothetical protein